MEKSKKPESKSSEEQINSVSNLFSLLSNPVRIKILWLLKKKKSQSVHQIQEALKIGQSNISQNLALLKLHRLVFEERKGKEVYYGLKESKMLSKVLLSAINLVGYQITANSELIAASTEFISMWA